VFRVSEKSGDAQMKRKLINKTELNLLVKLNINSFYLAEWGL
jgi:hypothetical protein